MSFKEYIDSNKERFLNELFDLIRIPSVSAVSEHNNDTRNAAKFLFNQFESGNTIDVQYLGKVYVANEDDDGDTVLNFLDAFPEDASKSKDDDYDKIDDVDDTDIVQRVMTWIKHLDKDIFELSED